jgi:hypothetical protein
MKWIAHLRVDSHAWDDFQQWLREGAYRELKKLATVDRDGHDFQSGVIKGWESVLSEATAGEREEKAKHGYERSNRDAS